MCLHLPVLTTMACKTLCAKYIYTTVGCVMHLYRGAEWKTGKEKQRHHLYLTVICSCPHHSIACFNILPCSKSMKHGELGNNEFHAKPNKPTLRVWKAYGKCIWRRNISNKYSDKVTLKTPRQKPAEPKRVKVLLPQTASLASSARFPGVLDLPAPTLSSRVYYLMEPYAIIKLGHH